MKDLIPSGIALIAFLGALVAPAAGAAVETGKYGRILATPEGRAKLESLARMEDSRSADQAELSSLARDGEPLIRLRCAEVLGRNPDSAGVGILRELIDDPDPDVRETAVFSLGLIGGGGVLGPLRHALAREDVGLRVRCLEALARSAERSSASMIVPFLSDSNSRLRKAAAVSLGLLADSSAAAACLPLLRDEVPEVVASAAYAIGRLGCSAAAGGLLSLLGDEDPEVRMRAAEALGRLESKDALPALSRMLGDPERMVAVKSVEAISRIGTPEAGELLVSALATDDPYVRTVALRGLAGIGGERFFEAALGCLRDESLMVRVAALRAAVATGGVEARPHALSVFDRGSDVEKAAALEILGELSQVQDLRLLSLTLSSRENHLLREGAAAGLGKWKRPVELWRPIRGGDGEPGARTPMDFLLEAAGGEDWVVGAIALESLGKVGSSRVIPDIIRISAAHDGREDSDRKLAALGGIRGFDRDSTLSGKTRGTIASFLEGLSRDGDPRVRRAAREALESYGLELSGGAPAEWKRGEPPWKHPPLPLGKRRIMIVTSRGEIEIELYGDDAPAVARSILALAGEGFYDGLSFHRVVPGFVIQGGCPRGDGWGDAGYYLRSQFNLHRYERGTVGMAHAGKDTPGSQIFITQTAQPHLDGRYTVVGRVTRGMDVVDRIEVGDTFRAEPIGE